MTKTITIPRGQNIGRTILSTFKTPVQYRDIDIKRDVPNKSCIATINYTYF